MDFKKLLEEYNVKNDEISKLELLLVLNIRGVDKRDLFNLTKKDIDVCLSLLRKYSFQEIPLYQDLKDFYEISEIAELKKNKDLHYSEIDKLDLSEKEKCILDYFISHFRENYYIYLNSALFKRLKIDSFMTMGCWYKLYKMGVIEIVHRYTTKCSCSGNEKFDLYLYQKEYEDLELFYSDKRNELSPSELKELGRKVKDEILSFNYATCQSCDDYFEIESIQDLNSYAEICFKLLKS